MISGAAQPVAPYSHAVEVGEWILLTGQVPNDPPNDKAPLPPDIEGQTRRTIENLRLVLEGLGLGLGQIVAARVFLTHFEEDYERMNAVYRSYFKPDRLPARTCIGVTALARGARIEIDGIARRP
jgi:reactive intermediate/imine deaminase